MCSSITLLFHLGKNIYIFFRNLNLILFGMCYLYNYRKNKVLLDY